MYIHVTVTSQHHNIGYCALYKREHWTRIIFLDYKSFRTKSCSSKKKMHKNGIPSLQLCPMSSDESVSFFFLSYFSCFCKPVRLLQGHDYSIINWLIKWWWIHWSMILSYIILTLDTILIKYFCFLFLWVNLIPIYTFPSIF